MTRNIASLTDEQINAMTPAQLRATMIEAEAQFRSLASRVVAKHGNDPEILRDIEEITRRLGA